MTIEQQYLAAPSIGVMEAAKSPISVLLTRMLIIAALTATMLAATALFWPRVSFWQQKRIARQLIAELEQSDGPQILVVLKQVSSLGNPAIEPLVLAAASERASVALAARRVIEQQFATWQIRAEQDEQFSLAEPTTLLAAALANHVDKFGAFGQQWATRLALDIVDLTGTFDVEAAVPVLANCNTVLSAVPALGPRMLTPTDPLRPIESEKNLTALPAMQVPTLPYGEMNSSHEQPATRSESASHRSRGIGAATPTQRESPRSTDLPRESNWMPKWAAQPKSITAQSQPTSIDAPDTNVSGDLIDVPSPAEQAKMVQSFRGLETRELFIRSKHANPFELAAIRGVLVERGIAAEELELATKLLADDVAERLELIDELKVLPARTARRWLRELLADKDAEVRLRALTALATTNDPELPGIARDLAVRDTDRRVVELATQIMRERR